MVGVELVVGYLAAWVWRKTRRVAGAVDRDVDQVLDSSVERLHQVVLAKLGDDAALKQLESEAAANPVAGPVSVRTRQRVQLALEEAVERDPGFAQQLDGLLAELVGLEYRICVGWSERPALRCWLAMIEAWFSRSSTAPPAVFSVRSP
jgi:hypothetical protein